MLSADTRGARGASAVAPNLTKPAPMPLFAPESGPAASRRLRPFTPDIGRSSMHRYRSHNCAQLRKTEVSQTVRLSGWVHRVRDMAGCFSLTCATITA